MNAVSLRHRPVAQAMFPTPTWRRSSDGVHAATWAVPSIARLLDRHAPTWRRDNTALHDAGTVPLVELGRAHAEAKEALLAEVARRDGRRLDPHVCTLGVARRATAYKRNDLPLGGAGGAGGPRRRADRCRWSTAGRPTPATRGKEIIRRVAEAARVLGDDVPGRVPAGSSIGPRAPPVPGHRPVGGHAGRPGRGHLARAG